MRRVLEIPDYSVWGEKAASLNLTRQSHSLTTEAPLSEREQQDLSRQRKENTLTHVQCMLHYL